MVPSLGAPAALRVLVVALIALIPATAWPTPITVSGVFHHRDTRSDNITGLVPGDFVNFGAVSAVPNGAGGTAGVATQGTAVVPLAFIPTSVAPNLFSRSAFYDPALTGSWTLTFTNGPDTTVVATPTVGPVDAAPFVRSVTISGSGSRPTFSWAVPAGFAPDGVVIRIYDLESPKRGAPAGVGGLGLHDTIHFQSLLPSDTSFTAPALTSAGIPLVPGRRYSIEIGLAETRGHVPAASVTTFLRQSRAFFDFTLLEAGAPPSVVLPTLGLTGVYTFDTDVVAGTTVFIDPLVAIGYDYAIGPGDPGFASVLLPSAGDGLYDLYLWDGAGWVSDEVLSAGVVHDFDASGVDRFRILGIEAGAGLDPLDATAFITGLTFTEDGRFTGTMTPITAEVPGPASLFLVSVGVIGLGGLAWRRAHRKH
ncbi:MAG: hypothetical protein Q7W02_12835 [Candidatus Rokubacteria bacterium]|nr:hypothetical protein [Candidatus Rokubacteria bacterium]